MFIFILNNSTTKNPIIQKMGQYVTPSTVLLGTPYNKDIPGGFNCTFIKRSDESESIGQ